MLQLHLSDRQFYCLLRCVLYKRFYGTNILSLRSATGLTHWILAAHMWILNGYVITPGNCLALVQHQAQTRTNGDFLCIGVSGAHYSLITRILIQENAHQNTEFRDSITIEEGRYCVSTRQNTSGNIKTGDCDGCIVYKSIVIVYVMCVLSYTWSGIGNHR